MSHRNYNILIHKYLTGEISSEEKGLLEVWLAASPENQHAFDEIRQIWENVDGEDEMNDEDFRGEMEKLESAVQESVDKDKLIKEYQRLGRVRNLALIAIVVLAGVFAAIPYFQKAPTYFVSFLNKDNNMLLLPDSTKVLLNRNSSMVFNDAEDAREAVLSGEAMFDVKKAIRPFTVSAGNVLVTVLGTSFVVKAYPDSGVQVMVISGKVNVRLNDENVILHKGEKALTINSGSLSKSLNEDPNFNSWYTRKLEFRNTELEKVLKLVEELYQISFRVNEKRILSCRFTGKFDNAKLEDVLKTLSFSLDIDFTSQLGNYYQVSGKGCVP
jgi:ferric-dicitrate binding protein FerR (iron transport regulator)